MAIKFSRAPSRSYEPLARRMCKAVYDIMDARHSQWVSVTRVSDHIKVKDPEMLTGAMSVAAQAGWLQIGGQPAHSLLLTPSGEQAALKKK